MIKLEGLKALVGSYDFKLVGVTILYLLAASLGLWLLFADINSYPIWPPAGVALALMIILGYRIWPAILIGSLITFTAVFTLQGVNININAVMAILGISIGSVIESLVGYKLYQMFINEDSSPHEKTSNTFIFLAITLFIAFIGSLTYTIGIHSFLPSKNSLFSTTFFTNYLSQLTGLWLFTNLILAWVKSKTHFNFNWWKLLESAINVSVIGFMLYIMNYKELSEPLERSFPFLIIPLLLWVAFRSSIKIVTFLVLTISLFSVYITINFSGPFILENSKDSLLLLQLFILVIGITVVILSTAIYERIEASNKLSMFNENLEIAVDKRTEQLASEIIRREKTEKKTLLTNNELRKTNEELDNFVYKVSHDLRAPISSILGLVNIAKYDTDVSNMLACIKQIEKSAITQDNFIKDIIELTKNARIKPVRQKIDFEKLVDETFHYLKYSMNSKPPKPKLNVLQNKIFYSDISRMKVIFNNIISNSIKYSDPNNTEIDINIEVVNGHAKINIGDKGNGIEKKYQEDVFKMFFRATDQNAGSGLGLYIVKETIQKLNGNVSIESEINKGTTLKMRLPNMRPRR
ncbi:MAG: MASE1 domain-containing protein [Cyclobacteriaceae bacterium]|nr:MASE1 domain-containing protein [Cyclobacteriaceae bacterium]